jgi:hypothetical protein
MSGGGEVLPAVGLVAPPPADDIFMPRLATAERRMIRKGQLTLAFTHSLTAGITGVAPRNAPLPWGCTPLLWERQGARGSRGQRGSGCEAVD